MGDNFPMQAEMHILFRCKDVSIQIVIADAAYTLEHLRPKFFFMNLALTGLWG